MSLPKCCVQAMERGEHQAHALACERRLPKPPEEPETAALFDLPATSREEGGPLL